MKTFHNRHNLWRTKLGTYDVWPSVNHFFLGQILPQEHQKPLVRVRRSVASPALIHVTPTKPQSSAGCNEVLHWTWKPLETRQVGVTEKYQEIQRQRAPSYQTMVKGQKGVSLATLIGKTSAFFVSFLPLKLQGLLETQQKPS